MRYTKLVLFILLVTEFFHLRIIVPILNKFISDSKALLVYIFLFIVLTKWNQLQLSKQEKNITLVLTMSAVINILSCFLIRGQSVLISLQAWLPLLVILFYVTIKSWNYSVKELEKSLFVVYIIVLISYITQYLLYVTNGTFIFFTENSEYSYEYHVRVRLFSDAILFLGMLFSLNKFLLLKQPKMLILYLLGVVMIFMQGYLTLFVGTVIASIFMLYKVLSVSKRIIYQLCLFAIVFFSFSQIPAIQEKWDETIERHEIDNFDNEDYARVLDYGYFLSDSHYETPIEYVTGTGLPIFRFINDNGIKYIDNKSVKSDYSNYMGNLAADSHMFTVDMGLVGLAVVAGIPFTLMLLILLILLVLRSSSNYCYLGGYSIICLSGFFTNGLIYKGHSMIFFALVLVLFTTSLDSNISHLEYESKQQ